MLIAEEIFVKNRQLILEQVSGMSDTASNLSRIKMWKVKQNICPKFEVNIPVAKMDESGNLISNQDELKKLYVNTYQYRLRHREMTPTFSYLKNLKDNLFEERLALSKLRKTSSWTEENLLYVLKSLKLKNLRIQLG